MVSRGHYSEKDAAKAVKEMLIAVKVSLALFSLLLKELTLTDQEFMTWKFIDPL